MDKFSLDSYKFDNEIQVMVSPLVDFMNKGDVDSAQKFIANLAIEVVEEIKAKSITPKQGDEVFTLIDIYIGDNYCDIQLDALIKELVDECMILHDLGTEFGADTKLIVDKATEYLNRG